MNDILVHHGVMGQKWGVRRYQNEDGSLTPAGKQRYSTGATSGAAAGAKSAQSIQWARRNGFPNANSYGSYLRKQNSSKNPLSVRRQTTVDRGVPYDEYVKEHGTSRGRNPLNIQDHWETVPLEPPKSDRNPLNIQTNSSVDRGVPLEEYLKKQEEAANSTLNKVKNALADLVKKTSKKVKDISKSVVDKGKKIAQDVMKAISKAAVKVKDVAKAVAGKAGNALKKLLNVKDVEGEWERTTLHEGRMSTVAEATVNNKRRK